MKMTERSDINRSAAEVWPFVVTPEHFQKWNDKIVSMETQGRFAQGQAFATYYQMGKNGIKCTTNVTQVIEEQELVLHHTNCIGEKMLPGNNLDIVERVTLKNKGAKTVVIKEVTITNHHMNIFLAALVWFITHFGKRAGPDKLKQLCEDSAN
jgi:hypothetical protein